MSLYIVPPDGGKGGAPSKPRRRASICLTPAESDALSAALQGLHRRGYTWVQLGELCGVSRDTLRTVANGRTPGSPGLAVRVAHVAGISIDRVLTPGPSGTTHCPTCKRPL